MNILMLVIKFVPLVIAVVRGVEPLFPQKGWGPFKLSVVLNILGHVYDLLSGDALTKDSLFAKLPAIISGVVDELNKKPEAWTADQTAPTPAAA